MPAPESKPAPYVRFSVVWRHWNTNYHPLYRLLYPVESFLMARRYCELAARRVAENPESEGWRRICERLGIAYDEVEG